MSSHEMLSHKLPASFEWGLATAAYQIEGAAASAGRGPSIWDEFCHAEPAKCAGAAHGDVACDHYNRMEEDVALLASLGVPLYRFSISWSRVIPLGGRNDPVNEEGLAFYDKLIDLLLSYNITPWVTLYHWDLPLALHERYGGPLNLDEFNLDFQRYGRLLFSRYGDRVQNWITFNEPWIVAIFGYGTGRYAPGRSSTNPACNEGDSTREPWIVGKTLIMSHANVVRIYNREFRKTQRGQISIVLNGHFWEPFDKNSELDRAAAYRRMEFQVGWFGDPIFLAQDYPECMRQQLGDRLPRFTEAEFQVLREALDGRKADYYGMNYYTAMFARHRDEPPDMANYNGNVKESQVDIDNTPVGADTGLHWLRVCPAQFRKFLSWIYGRYQLPIFITENGCPCPNEANMTKEEAVEDDFRVRYIESHIDAISKAINVDGVQVPGWMGWSLMDNLAKEWDLGFDVRFGMVHTNYENLERTPKKSAKILKKLIDSRMASSHEMNGSVVDSKIQSYGKL